MLQLQSHLVGCFNPTEIFVQRNNNKKKDGKNGKGWKRDDRGGKFANRNRDVYRYSFKDGRGSKCTTRCERRMNGLSRTLAKGDRNRPNTGHWRGYVWVNTVSVQSSKWQHRVRLKVDITRCGTLAHPLRLFSFDGDWLMIHVFKPLTNGLHPSKIWTNS